MKLRDLDFIKLLPQFMRDDQAVRGLAAGINQLVPETAESISALSDWNNIDTMTSNQLDELAWELNILWYNPAASLEVRRSVIKNSDKVYKHLGTKWAVQNVIHSYFGDGTVEEWWQYDGQPGHFRIMTANQELEAEKLSECVNIVNKVKRASAKLDEIIITASGKAIVHIGAAVHDTDLIQLTAKGGM